MTDSRVLTPEARESSRYPTADIRESKLSLLLFAIIVMGWTKRLYDRSHKTPHMHRTTIGSLVICRIEDTNKSYISSRSDLCSYVRIWLIYTNTKHYCNITVFSVSWHGDVKKDNWWTKAVERLLKCFTYIKVKMEKYSITSKGLRF